MTIIDQLTSSIQAMIDASVASALEKRLGLTHISLDARIEAKINSALEKRLGPTVGPLTSQIETSVAAAFDQQLDRAGRLLGLLEAHIDSSLVAALEQRFGPAGSPVRAQIIFTASNTPVAQPLNLNPDGPSQTAFVVSSTSQSPHQGSHTEGQILTPVKDHLENVPKQLKSGEENTANLVIKETVQISDQAKEGGASVVRPSEKNALKPPVTAASLPEKSTSTTEIPEEDNSSLANTKSADSPLRNVSTQLAEADKRVEATTDLSPSAKRKADTNNPTIAVTNQQQKEKPTECDSAEGNRSMTESSPNTIVNSTRENSITNGKATAVPTTMAGRYVRNISPALSIGSDVPPSVYGENTDTTTTAMSPPEKRGVNGTERTSVSSNDSEKDESPRPLKRRKKAPAPPGFTEGPPIRFSRACTSLTASVKRRGYPRLVDLESFAKESNKQNLTMADIVATVLWNHMPQTLYQFLDFDNRPTFSFVREESDNKTQDFFILRERRDKRIKVSVCIFQAVDWVKYLIYWCSVDTTTLKAILSDKR